MTELRSIYDYPEHLNPFYEKDNLKRLRFWKVGKNDENFSSSRRRSFSFGSLKSLLPLKSFRLSKKSSALGISKTSESPPPMRKDLWNYSLEEPNRYTTYNPHFRSSVQGLEKLNSNSLHNGLSFGNRNDQYRRTVQLGALRRGAVETSEFNTPTFRDRYKSSNMSLKSSLNSINMNPFEHNDDYTSMNKPSRKKRQAPLPPKDFCRSTNASQELKNDEFCRLTAKLTAEFETFVKEVLPNKESSSTFSDKKNSNGHFNDECRTQAEICTTMDGDLNKTDSEKLKVEGIRFMETTTDFIKEKDNEKHDQNVREETPDYIPLTVREQFHLRIEEDFDSTVENLTLSDNVSQTLDSKHENDSLPRSKNTILIQPSVSTSNSVCNEKSDIIEPVQQDCIEKQVSYSNYSLYKKFVESSPQPLREESRISELKSFEDKVGVESTQTTVCRDATISTSKIKCTHEDDPIPKPQIHDEIINLAAKNESNEVRSSQPSDRDSNTSGNSRLSTFRTESSQLTAAAPQPLIREVTPIPVPKTEYDIPYARQRFIKTDSLNVIQVIAREKNDRKIPPTPPPRRRSIKDVIESINRNQKLLKINQPAPVQSRCYEFYNQKEGMSVNNSLEKFQQQQAESEKNINEILEDLQNYRNESLKVENSNVALQ